MTRQEIAAQRKEDPTAFHAERGKVLTVKHDGVILSAMMAWTVTQEDVAAMWKASFRQMVSGLFGGPR